MFSIFFKFLPRGAMLSVVYAVVVCLSVCVCLSVTFQYYTKTAKSRIRQIMPHDSPGALVFTARGYAKRGNCRRRVSVCLSHSGIVSKRLNVGSRKQRRMTAP